MTMKKVNSLVIGMAATMFATGVNASSVFVNPSQISAVAGETFNATIQADFSDIATGVDTGGFLLTWDTSMITLVDHGQSQDLDDAFFSYILNNGGASFPTGVLPIVDIANGSIDFGFSNCGFSAAGSNCESVGTVFDVYDLVFQVNEDVVGTTEAGLSIGKFGSIWTTNGTSEPLDVTFTGATITVSAVPVPSAVWLLGTAMIGLVGMGRERQIKSA